MIAGDIISEIIKRMKFWGSRFPDATTSFIPDTRGNSFGSSPNCVGLVM